MVPLLFGPIDDDFLSIQDWIVSHGRSVMRRVKTNPDCLVELADDLICSADSDTRVTRHVKHDS